MVWGGGLLSYEGAEVGERGRDVGVEEGRMGREGRGRKGSEGNLVWRLN